MGGGDLCRGLIIVGNVPPTGSWIGIPGRSCGAILEGCGTFRRHGLSGRSEDRLYGS